MHRGECFKFLVTQGFRETHDAFSYKMCAERLIICLQEDLEYTI